MNEKTKTALTAAAFGAGVAGGAYGGWAIINAILAASPLTQFLVAVGALSAGGMATFLNLRGS